MNDKPKRVLIFSLTYFPKFVGGDGVAIKEITDRISENEMEFDIITLHLEKNLPKFEKIGNVNVYRVGFSKKDVKPQELLKFPMYLNKILFPLTACIKAFGLHKKNKYDLIWSMMTYAGFPAVFFNLFHKKVPIFLTLQDGDPLDQISGRWRIKLVYPIFKRIFKIPSYVQSISHYLSNFAKDMGYEGESSVIPNGVNVKHFENIDYQKVDEIKDQYKKSEDDVWLITSSRLVHKNAVDDIVRSLALLPENIKLLIAGEGPDRKKIDCIADELGVTDRIIQLGYIDHASLPSYLHASNIFIRPSRTEGFGNSFVEAMAAGIPVIASDAGGIIDFLHDKETGLICSIDDPGDIARKVEIYLHDINLREEIIQNAKQMVVEQYDWDNISDDMKTIFMHIVKNR